MVLFLKITASLWFFSSFLVNTQNRKCSEIRNLISEPLKSMPGAVARTTSGAAPSSSSTIFGHVLLLLGGCWGVDCGNARVSLQGKHPRAALALEEVT